MEQTKRVIRHCAPTRLDALPYRTLWIHWVTKDKTDYYMQTSEDSNKPQWESMGDIMINAFRNFMQDDQFIDECLNLYKLSTNKSFTVISELIKERYLLNM